MSRRTLSLLISLSALAPAALRAAPAESPLCAASTGALRQDPAEEYVEVRTRAAQEFVASYEELATWCQRNKAYLERDRAYEAILALDGEHAAARKQLGYTYDKRAEEWVRKRKYREPKNAKAELALEAADRRKALQAEFAERMVGLVEKYSEKLDAEFLRTELEALLVSDPDNARLRKLLGHERVELRGKQVWLPAEIARSFVRRKQLFQRVRELEKGVTIEEDEVESAEQDWGVDWKRALKSSRVRVVSSGGEDETRTIVEDAHLLWDFLPEVIGGKLAVPRGLVVFVLDGEDNKAAFLDTYPDLSNADRAELPELGSAWLGGKTRLGLWSLESELRVDQACKQMTSLYLWQAFQVKGDKGWLVEGVGLYINEMVTGTKRSFQVTDTEYEETVDRQLDARLRGNDSNWLGLTRELLAGTRSNKLAFALGRNTNQMTAEDLLLSYTLIQFLSEAHGKDALERVLTRAGKEGHSPVQVLEDELGMPLPAIQERLLDWLNAIDA